MAASKLMMPPVQREVIKRHGARRTFSDARDSLMLQDRYRLVTPYYASHEILERHGGRIYAL